jgi:16S rRNA (guanine(966)-N(2))-methyltransferase RsmD
MRVIAGIYKGRNIVTPQGRDVRPTSDKVKGAVFSMLECLVAPGAGEGALAGLRCLDLFAGTGALGLEALSRGAASCTFVDVSPAAAAALEENTRFVRGGSSARILRSDWRLALRRMKKDIDIVFVDPPYGAGYYDEVMKMLHEYDIIVGDGFVVVESQDTAGAYEGFALLREKRYGKTRIGIYERL